MSGRDVKAERRAFLVLLALQVLAYGYLILTRRIPKGHDTLSVYWMQYLFQAHAAQGSSALLWMPNFAHGIVSTWFANLQSSPLQNALLLGGGAPVGTPMPLLFHAGLFLEDLILLIGVWHLGGRIYRRTSARFFVAAAAAGSSLWVSNIYWNHRLIYAVPLIVALFLDFLESGSRPRAFLAGTLAVLQLTGNAIYIPVLSSLTVALFIGSFAWIHRKRLRLSLPLLRPRRADALWTAAFGIVAAGVCTGLVQGMGSVRQFHEGRNVDGTVTLDAFLTFPGGVNPLRYLDFFLGLTPSTDYSLYCGLLTAVFAVLAIAHRPGRATLHLSVVLLVLLFFSMGYLSLVGMVGYYAAWPLHYFRYVALAGPLVKLLVILLAGFGVDAFAGPRQAPSYRTAAVALGMLALLSIRLLWVRAQGTSEDDALSSLLDVSRLGLAPREAGLRGVGVLPSLLGAATAAMLLFARRARSGAGRTLIPLLLIIHVGDLFFWRMQMLREGTVALEPAAAALHRLEPVPYLPRRTMNYEESARYRAVGEGLLKSGASYDYVEAFLHLDPSWSRFYVTQWSASVDLLLRARARRPMSGGEAPPGFPSNPSTTEIRPLSYSKAVGEAAPKIQLFTTARRARSDEEIANILNRPGYPGDVLLLSPTPDSPGSPLDGAEASLRNERLDLSPRIVDFSGDRLHVEVDLPPTPAEAWLVYCDAWHPDWTAAVDGVRMPVERANLAYKAVRLHSGKNRVDFRFRSPVRYASARLTQVLSLSWCGISVGWALGLLGLRIPRVQRARSDGSAPP